MIKGKIHYIYPHYRINTPCGRWASTQIVSTKANDITCKLCTKYLDKIDDIINVGKVLL